MKIEHRNGRLIVKDRSLVFWMFYSFFVVDGIVALVLSVSAAKSRKSGSDQGNRLILCKKGR